MKANFGNCLKLTLQHEGGYVNHPRDPGGATNYGVIQRTYDGWRKAMGKAPQTVRDITMGEVHSIYRNNYWRKVKGDYIPIGIDYTVFDASVNSGTGRGPKWTQAALGLRPDGIVGPKTIAALEALDEQGVVTTIKKANGRRLGFLKGLRHWSTFGRGWSRRVLEVEAGSIGMVSGPHVLRDESKASKKAIAKEASGGVTTGLGGTAVIGTMEIPAEALVIGGILVALFVVVLVKRAVVAYDRAQILAKVADQIDELGD